VKVRGRHALAAVFGALVLASTLTGCITIGAQAQSTFAGAGVAASSSPSCTPTVVYNHIKDEGSALDVVDIQTAYNGTDSPEPFTLTSENSHTVSIQETTANTTGFTAEVGGSAGFTTPVKWLPSASVQAQAIYRTVHQTDSTVQQDATVSAGSAIQMSIPAGATGYGLLGVVMKITRGDLHSAGCAEVASTRLETVIIPTEYEWCTFVRGPDEFTAGGSGSSQCRVVAYDLGS
jgi:hypothetical protein